LGHFLVRTWLGRILLVLVVARIASSAGLAPPWLTSVSTIGLWAYVAGLVLWRIARLRTMLLWRIRRKLIISYLLIGLVPTLLILFFFLLSAFFIVGQVSSYVLNTEIRRIDTEVVTAGDLAVSDIQGMVRNDPHPSDRDIRAILARRLAPISERFPGSGAIYLEHRRGRIQRVVATEDFAYAPQVGTTLAAWATEAYQGPIHVAETNYLGGVSAPVSGQEGTTVLLLCPLGEVLARAAADMGFHIDQVVASLSKEGEGAPVLLHGGSDDPARPPGPKPFTLPWWTLLQSRSLDQPRSQETDLVFVQFGFAPMMLYQSIAESALQLGPDGPDLGRLVLFALALLAILFLVIEVAAIFVGLMLARSITGSVHALSQGTEHVRQGDFGHKVQVRSRDQLGELADSFNLMTTSIQELLNQSAEKERLEEELRIARTIQMSLLPKDRISVPGLSIAWLCLPANEVGGDYCDFIHLSDGRLALLIADVSGKGTSAALYMAELKGITLSLSRMYDSPRLLLIEANKILAANLDSRSFITMAYAIIDMKERRMTYARAGHNPIFHLTTNGDGAITRVLAPEGLGLALDRGTTFETILEEESVELASGDLFLFYTDGVSEAMNDRSELFGEDRIRAIMEENAELPTEELREKMIDEVFSFAGGAVQHDDMTMVLVKVL
jgi:serine phosphatase RsbU (regulator of sigma subunit)